ncbi:MAG: ribosome biogenesis GTPase YlqF [Burkholderiales bacterium]|nr:ribosome biogenesis GTPase YlqF [Burkholderiales bacterium]
MSIQWFPGHMNAARKKAAETMEDTDMVIEVLDARLPMASSNPMVEQLRQFRQRPCLKILNKSDLADPDVTAEWIRHFEAQKNTHVVAISCKKPADVNKIPGICQKIAPHRGVPTKPLRMMIMGIPNVGKSTLMNALLKKRVAKVGDEPAVTKVQQRLYLGKNMILIDTPGMLWPKIALPDDGLMLAASHAVGVNAVVEEEVAAFLAEILLARYPKLLQARYGINCEGLDGVGVLEGVAQRRAMRVKGGDFDLEKAAHVLLFDYRTGALGRISLENPSTREAALQRFALEREEYERKQAEQAKERAAFEKRGKRDSNAEADDD